MGRKRFGGRTDGDAKAPQRAGFRDVRVGNDNDLRGRTLGADGAFDGMKKGATSSTTHPPRREVARE